MGFWDSINSAGQSVNRAMYGRDLNTFSDVRGAIYGDQSDPGMAGQGYRKPGEVSVDPNARALPNYAANRSNSLAAALQAQGRAGPSTGYSNISQGPQDQFRQGQLGLAYQLSQQAAGQGPSLAQQQLQAGTDRNIAQAMAMAQAQQGQGAGLAQRQVAQQQAGMAAQTNQDAGALRLQEQMQAQNMLGQVLAGGRGQDIGLATEQAGLNQGANLANLQATLSQRGMNDARSQFYDQAAMGQDLAQGQQNLSFAQLMAQNAQQNQQSQQQAYEDAARRRMGFFGGLVQQGAEGAGKLASSLGPALAMI